MNECMHAWMYGQSLTHVLHFGSSKAPVAPCSNRHRCRLMFIAAAAATATKAFSDAAVGEMGAVPKLGADERIEAFGDQRETGKDVRGLNE